MMLSPPPCFPHWPARALDIKLTFRFLLMVDMAAGRCCCAKKRGEGEKLPPSCFCSAAVRLESESSVCDEMSAKKAESSDGCFR